MAAVVTMQDDVNALAVTDASGSAYPVPLSPHASGRSVFDDALGNKHEKLDLEAGMFLADGRLVAFGGALVQPFHRGNDTRASRVVPQNAIIDVNALEFVHWLAGGAAVPRVVSVTTVDLGALGGVPFGFTDAVALRDGRIVVLACAEDSACAISDGAALGCRVGLLDRGGLRTVVDVDRGAVPAQLGRLVREWQ